MRYLPAAGASNRTISTLFSWSTGPSAIGSFSLPATFWPAGVSTSRFRLFCSARPGASVHTRQMLKRVPAATVIS